MRDQREIASNMQAWWVYRETEYGKQWGIVLSTTYPVNSVFFDVRLTVLNKGRSRGKNRDIPPGQYFIPSVFKESKYSTGQPVLDKPKLISAEEIEKYQPLLHAANYVVKQIEFRDQLGQQWLWTLKEGLTSL